MADVLSSAQDLIKCLKCKSYPLGNVNQCSNGDIICATCYTKAKGVCFKCGNKYPNPPIRSTLAEQILDKMEFECLYKHGSQGCQAKMARSEKENHEKRCKFRSVTVCSLLGLLCKNWNCCKIEYYNWETTRQNFEARPTGFVDSKTGRVNIQLMDFPTDAETTRIAWNPVLIKLHLTDESFIYSIFLAELVPEEQLFTVKVFHVADLDKNPANDFQINVCVPNNILKYPDLNWWVSPMSYLDPNKTAQLCCTVSALQSEFYMSCNTLNIQMLVSPRQQARSLLISDDSTDIPTVILKRVTRDVHLSPNNDGNGCCPSDSPVQFSPLPFSPGQFSSPYYYTPQYGLIPSVEPCTSQGPYGSKRPRTSLRSNAGDESDQSGSPLESVNGSYSPCPPTPTPRYA